MKKTFKSLGLTRSKLNNTSTQIFSYGSRTPLQQLGTIELSTEVSDLKCNVLYHVVAGDSGNLMGKQTSTYLGLITVNKLVNAVHLGTNIKNIISEYKDRFQGLGLLKDFKLKIHIDPTVQAVAQSVRRMPYTTRERVDKKIKELLDADIIEKLKDLHHGYHRW